MKDVFKIGVIGCGDISTRNYVPNIMDRFSNMEIYALCDLNRERAESLAVAHGIAHVLSLDEIFEDPEIDVILNLTNPQVHYELNMRALRSGKHVYSEKPLGLNLKEASDTIALAKEKNLYVGCAPDVFLGAGVQTCRKVIEDGLIGDILSAKVANMYHGPENIHPAPDFFYKIGAGPMLDIGPYGISEMLYFMGPAEELCCYGGIGINPRPIKDHYTDVEVNTHYNGIVKFADGRCASVNFSWDTWGAENGPCVQVYGTKGSLFLSDPDNYGEGSRVHVLLEEDMRDENGKISREKTSHSGEYKKDIPLVFDCPTENRGLGLCEMIEAIKEGRPSRANGEFACHVTEVLDGFNIAIATGKPYKMQTTFQQISRMPEDFVSKMR